MAKRKKGNAILLLRLQETERRLAEAESYSYETKTHTDHVMTMRLAEARARATYWEARYADLAKTKIASLVIRTCQVIGEFQDVEQRLVHALESTRPNEEKKP